MNLQNQIDALRELYNADMFDGASVPTPLVKDDVISSIIFRCGLLQPIFSEPYITHQQVTLWFKTNQWTFEHLVNIILAEYSPIENTDKYSEHTETKTGDGTVTHSGKDTTQEKLSGTDQRDYSESGTDQRDITESGTDQRDITESGTDQRDITESGTDQRDIVEGGTTDVDIENTISAYNSNTYQPDNKSESTTTHGKTTDDDITYGKTTDDDITYGKTVDDDITYGKTVDDDITYGKSYDDDTTYGKQSDGYTQYGHTITSSDNGSVTYTEHTHGNIGVTTNQNMIEQELELLKRFNIYDWIAAKFERELCIQIY